MRAMIRSMTAGEGAERAPTRVVGIGASAGGVEALTGLVRVLPAGLPAALVVVLHVPSTGTSVLPQILDRAGPLRVVLAEDGAALEPGVIHVAPADRHVVVRDGHLHLSAGPRENGHRPAVDPTLTSIADAYGGRSVGVILSGARDDGTRGLLAIGRAGGTTLVQDPSEALFDGMIRSALQYVDVDAVLPLAQLADRLITLCGSPIAMDEQQLTDPEEATSATRYTCPDCGGALWRREEGGAVQFRCSVGHAYSPESLDGEQGRDVESALWAAVRLLGDRKTLLDEMARRADERGHARSATAFRDQATEIEGAALTIRSLIEGGNLPLAPVAAHEAPAA